MHASVMDFLNAKVAELHLDDGRSVVELGSYWVNGSAREAWPDTTTWTGYDIIDGPGVDVVCASHDVPIDDSSVDIVVCVEMLEHDPHPANTFAEIRRILRPEGVLLLTTRANGFVHHHPPDHHRFSDDDLKHLAMCELRHTWTPTEALDPVDTTPPTIVGHRPPLDILTLDPDPQYQHPGWLVVARRQ